LGGLLNIITGYTKGRMGRVAQGVECLPSRHGGPEFKPQEHKKNQKIKKTKRIIFSVLSCPTLKALF
jgi:hypothetical protein